MEEGLIGRSIGKYNINKLWILLFNGKLIMLSRLGKITIFRTNLSQIVRSASNFTTPINDVFIIIYENISNNQSIYIHIYQCKIII